MPTNVKLGLVAGAFNGDRHYQSYFYGVASEFSRSAQLVDVTR